MKKFLLYLTIGGALLTTSCSKFEDFGTTNQNPISTPYNTAQALRSTLVGLGSNTVWYSGLTRTGALYCQYFSETQYTDVSRYVPQNFDWDGFYAGPLFECQNIINTNTEKNTNANQTAVARIVRAYYFAFLTDLYGDIPYSAALKGTGVIAYDKQETIYPALLTELKAANAQFSGTGIDGDIMFNGNVARWKKFANSLRMLLAMRWVKFSASTAQAAFLDAYNDAAGHITTNADNAEFAYTGGGSYPNPFYQYYALDQRDDYAVSTPFMTALTNTNDKRRDAWTTSTVGFPYGLPRDQAVNIAAGWSKMMNANSRVLSSKMYLLTACHVGLLKAEAALRGWIAIDPKVAYEQAITDSWSQWGVGTPAALTTYLSNAAIEFVTTDVPTRLNRVYNQYWVSNFPNGWQGYSDWRRTDFPVLTPAAVGRPIPKRIPYGPNERNLNFANYSNGASLYTVGGTINSQDGAVTWDR
jgi:hypothetical protein